MINRRLIPAIVLLLSCSLVLSAGGSSSDESVGIPESEIQKRWVQDRQAYILANGNIYRDEGEGQYTFIVEYYEPGFFESNYSVDDEAVYLRFPDGEAKQIRTRNEYHDNFESYSEFLDLLLREEAVAGTEVMKDGIITYDYEKLSTRWGSLTLQSPNAPGVKQYVELRRSIVHEGGDFIDNRVDLSAEQSHSGGKSLRFYAVAPDRSMVTSKSSISTESVVFRKGDDFYFSGWFYFEKGIPTTIMDLESTWLEGHSGIRILFSREGVPYIELKAFDKPSLRNRDYQIPRNRWVEVKTHFVLDDVSGSVELWIDGEKVIEGMMQTLPLADTVLNSVEIGISATGEETILFVDDVRISAEGL